MRRIIVMSFQRLTVIPPTRRPPWSWKIFRPSVSPGWPRIGRSTTPLLLPFAGFEITLTDHRPGFRGEGGGNARHCSGPLPSA